MINENAFYLVVANKFTNFLKEELGGVPINQIRLYGSVHKGSSLPRDIDIAVIVDDCFRMTCCSSFDGYDELNVRIFDLCRKFKTHFKEVPFHVVPYWQSEYDNGIKMESLESRKPESLDDKNSRILWKEDE